MSWSWEFRDAAGVALPAADRQPTRGFPTQGEAETWVGETWRELLADGVSSVVLWEEGREVYGPMSLHPPTQ